MAHCDEALKLIGVKIKLYQKENDGKYPPSLETLVELKHITVWELVCPVSPFPVGESSYIYRGDDLFKGVAGDMIVAYDKVSGHKNRRNVLLADGKVRRPPEHVFEGFIKKDNELRQSFGLPEKKMEIVRLEDIKHLHALDDLAELEGED